MIESITNMTQQVEQVEQQVEQVEQQVEHIEQVEQQVEQNDNIIITSVEMLCKKKLDELYELAKKYDLNINTESGKKKKKADLANEIFAKIKYLG
jgi:methyl-accepting chemotaxis protein